MSKIRILNFGPIKNGLEESEGWIDINKVTLFIGNQGSGKSTIAKIISTFIWIEKALVRGDYDKKWFERKNRLKNSFFKYHRLENYLKKNTIIEYLGKAYSIKFSNNNLIIKDNNSNDYELPQVMYVPAERNFITYVKSPNELKLSSDALKEFLTEYDNAKEEIKSIKLPINDVFVEYDRLNDTVNIKGGDYKVKLTDASSGFQSLVPLYLVSSYLSDSVKKQSENNESMSSDEAQRFRRSFQDIINNEFLTDEQKRVAISVLANKFNKRAFINIVEEPEQNLFPSSQWDMLKSLLEFNNTNSGNKLIITTHSPYIVNFISISIQADYLRNEIIRNKREKELLPKLEGVLNIKSLISSDLVSIYQLNEKTGSIIKLPKTEGIPSDNNYLNNILAESNSIFDNLLEIEQEI